MSEATPTPADGISAPPVVAPVPQASGMSQEQVDAIVSDRLSRERAKYSDYDTLKANSEKLLEVNKQFEELTAQHAKTNELQDKLYQGMVAKVPEDKLSLIPEGYTTEQRIEYVQKNKAHFGIEAIPTSPDVTPTAPAAVVPAPTPQTPTAEPRPAESDVAPDPMTDPQAYTDFITKKYKK